MADSDVKTGRVVSRRDATVTTSGAAPRTEYVLVGQKGSSSGQQQTRTDRRTYKPYTDRRNPVPKGIPSWLGDRQVIFMSWGVSMILVTWDEWSVNDILPRPMRLWETTWVYAILAVLSIGPLTPLMNTLAIGFTIVLLWQFISKTGAFGK